MSKSFVVVIASYNNERWCQQNLESVLSQQHSQFRVIYVDDASTDDTVRLVDEYLAESGHAERVTFIRNQSRLGPVANIDRAVRSCDPSDVIVLVDGDDRLAHRQVLTRLDTIYRDPDVWVTWGQFTRVPHDGRGFLCEDIPAEIVSANAYRDYPFVSSHLRTFYAGLYQRIHPIDVQDGNGQFFTIAGDVAQMFALMEMAGPRGKFIPEVLYLYNRENPLNDDKVDRAAQVRTEMAIREKARYGRLASLSTSGPREFYIGTGVGRSFFNRMSPPALMEERQRPFRHMRTVLNRLGFTVRETQTLADVADPHAIVVFDVRPEDLQRLAGYANDMLTLVLWSDPISAPLNLDVRYHEPFRRIYTWCDDLVDDDRYFKLSFPFLRPMIDDVVPFEKRKLCTLIASNGFSDHPDALYDEERKVAAYFAEVEPDSFDLFGWGWSAALNRSYRGVCSRNVEQLRRCRFSFCYETVKGWSGYLTGKIFDSFEAGCVPVYWGAPDVADEIPGDCFIAREAFDSEAELHAFLRDMSASVHAGYLDRIRAFLSSPRAVRFSAEHFVRTFVQLTGGRAVPRVSGSLSPTGASLARASDVAAGSML